MTDDARHADAARRAGEDLKRLEREFREAFPQGDVQQTYLAVLAARALATGYGREWVCSNPPGARAWFEAVLGRASEFIGKLCGDSLSVRLTWRDGTRPPDSR